MPNDRESDGDKDGVEAPKVFISDDGPHDGCSVGPERVELAYSEGSTLAHVECTRLTFGSWITACGLNNAIDDRKRLLYEIGVSEPVSISS